MVSNPSSTDPSRTTTPTPAQNSRFTSASTAEDLLKDQTVGLVNLSDFRKRRAEAVEAKELGRFQSSSGGSGAATPSDGTLTPRPAAKKKKKNPAKGKLSFAVDGDEEDDSEPVTISKGSTPRPERSVAEGSQSTGEDAEMKKKRLGANATVGLAPKMKTKSALLKEAQTREQLRKEFLAMQEQVKATEMLVPFVFYDGTNIPGGVCKVKKGDPIWLFLDRSRKVGAELGVGGEGTKSRREWARVGVDDLMLVRGEIIIPHHYEFHYFIVNKTLGPDNALLFPYSVEPKTMPASEPSPAPIDLANYDPLSRPSKRSTAVTETDSSSLEGAEYDPNLTKVVDRRWYERNKHIFPASVWEEFDPTRDYSRGLRRDAEGNAFFF